MEQSSFFDPAVANAPLALRPYQKACVEAVYSHLRSRDDNPCRGQARIGRHRWPMPPVASRLQIGNADRSAESRHQLLGRGMVRIFETFLPRLAFFDSIDEGNVLLLVCPNHERRKTRRHAVAVRDFT